MRQKTAVEGHLDQSMEVISLFVFVISSAVFEVVDADGGIREHFAHRSDSRDHSHHQLQRL